MTPNALTNMHGMVEFEQYSPHSLSHEDEVVGVCDMEKPLFWAVILSSFFFKERRLVYSTSIKHTHTRPHRVPCTQAPETAMRPHLAWKISPPCCCCCGLFYLIKRGGIAWAMLVLEQALSLTTSFGYFSTLWLCVTYNFRFCQLLLQGGYHIIGS